MAFAGRFALVAICVILGLCLSPAHCRQPGGKYDETANNRDGGGTKDGRLPYRTKVVNQVWEKAQRMKLPPGKLDELANLLQQHDMKTLQLKKHTLDGGDPQGETEALLRRKLSDIMRQFGMIPLEDPRERSGKHSKKDMSREEFRDQRLNKLWAKAKMSPGFNALELDELKEELTHHQEKLEQFEHLSSELYGERSRPNRIEPADRKPMEPDQRSLLELDLKIQHRELNNNFQRLSAKMISDDHRGEFTEPRVINLWREAQFANFSQEELESIREELGHFEAKLTQYETLQVESLHAEKAYRAAKNTGEAMDPKKHHSMKEEARNLGSTVHQFMQDMRGRIQRGRDRMDEL